jgi:hypothetical protein
MGHRETKASRRILHMDVTDDWMDRLDAWRESQTVPPSRAAAVRFMVDSYLDSVGAPRQHEAAQ